MADKNRRPWTEKEDALLINQWDALGSITLISLLLGRSPSSVQTRASRLSLPRRVEEKNRHRRRWAMEDERHLKSLIDEIERKGRKIPILELADKMSRSVDAITAKLVEIYGEDEVLSRITIPEEASRKKEKLSGSEVNYNNPEPGSGYKATYRKAQQANPNARMRKCLACMKPFWSDGPQNRICNKCKKNQEDYYDWDW